MLLASNDVMKTGVGNQNDLVGRFFADNPIPRECRHPGVVRRPLRAVLFQLPHLAERRGDARGAFAHGRSSLKSHGVVGSLTTVENAVKLDPFGTAAVETTAQALGVDASGAQAYSLGCGMELVPDPDRRLTLTGERDALGMPRLKLAMSIADDDFARLPPHPGRTGPPACWPPRPA